MNTYEVTLHRIVEHETIFRVEAENEDDAIERTLSGDYIEIVEDYENGDVEDPQVIDVVIT